MLFTNHGQYSNHSIKLLWENAETTLAYNGSITIDDDITAYDFLIVEYGWPPGKWAAPAASWNAADYWMNRVAIFPPDIGLRIALVIQLKNNQTRLLRLVDEHTITSLAIYNDGTSRTAASYAHINVPYKIWGFKGVMNS